ncbi:hypothetical protein G7050_11895 [Dysgonomonas sp. HDW5A]|uniref:hypothetical protein n=1 Tax=Dysgonomonas sp. HDW5A TaxID=2714926 RepID=UPI00140A9796|nr:hypothetical protein [Dysgonomonas sp. HDW5A]QIK60491.1 hypothetical protein G7050_11895 [Dysgonomonas sp. HDW5A]
MKTDLYTKTVLTVIAVCLTVNLLKEFEVIPTAKANTAATSPTPIPTSTQAAPVDVNITHIGGRNLKSFNNNEYIPVDIQHNYDK